MLTAQELRSQRQAHKMTLAQLAEAVGIEKRLMTDYEKGTVSISVEHADKLEKLWQATPAEKKLPAVKANPKKEAPAKTPSVTQWLQNVAQENSAHAPKPATTAAVSASDAITQATAQLTTDKQRRLALSNLLTVALNHVDDVFIEDKPTRAIADAIGVLRPAHAQLILGVIEQLENIKPLVPGKAKLPAHEQVVQALTGASPYETLINYLQAAVQVLKQAEIAEQPPLVTRLQGLSEFDRSTVQLLIKRYQDVQPPKEDKPDTNNQTPPTS